MKSDLTGAMVFVKFRSGNAAPIRPNKWSDETTVIHYTEHPLHVQVGNSKKMIYREFCDLGEKLFLTRACCSSFFWKIVLSTVHIIIWYNIHTYKKFRDTNIFHRFKTIYRVPYTYRVIILTINTNGLKKLKYLLT